MKRNPLQIVQTRGCALALIIVLSACQTAAPVKPPPAAAAAAPPPSPAEQMGYLFGLSFGTQMHSVGISNEISAQAVTRGIEDALLQGKQPTPAEQEQLQRFVRSAAEAAVVKNQAAAKDFLDSNGKQPGVVTTPSGLEYKVLDAGNAQAPPITPLDTVTVQYRGKLLDGSEFDSSYARNQPATFPVNGVIQGWQEALVLMKPGAKWQLFIPPALAYGAAAKPRIPAGSVLIFDV